MEIASRLFLYFHVCIIYEPTFAYSECVCMLRSQNNEQNPIIAFHNRR